MKYSAIILAAGGGSRIKSLTVDNKILLKVNGKTLLEWHLINLSNCGIHEVLIVMGYNSGNIINEINKHQYPLNIKYVFNKNYIKYGNAYSMYQGISEADPKNHCLIVDGDFLYENQVLNELLMQKYDECILLAEADINDIECAKTVVNNKGYVVLMIDKRELTDEELHNNKFVGEGIGMIMFSKKKRRKVLELCNLFFSEENNLIKNWEHLMNQYFVLENVNYYKISSKYKSIEIDTPEDYRDALELFKDTVI